MKITSCFDWFQCTFDHITYHESFDINMGIPSNFKQIDEILTILKMPDKFSDIINELKYGFLNYKFKLQLVEGITLLFFGSINKFDKHTTLLICSGVGCKYLTEHKIWFDLFNYCNSVTAHWTRLDPACDLRGKSSLNMWMIYNCILNDKYKSIFSKGYTITGQIPQNEDEGLIKPLTIYAGSKGSSSSFTRIYNKAVEQGLDPLNEPWIRIEMQIQDFTKINCIINAFLTSYIDNNLEIFNSVVLGTLHEFLTLLDDNDEIHPLWLELLNSASAIEIFSSPKASNSFDKKEDWFKRSCGNFLAMYTLVYGEKELNRFIYELVYENMSSLERSSLNCVNSKMYDLGFGMNKYSLSDVHKLGINNYKNFDFEKNKKSNY